MTPMRFTSVAAAALIMALPTASAMAQSQPDVAARPVYGSVALAAGFTPDPHEITVQPGGDLDISHLGASCVGYVGRAPDYQVDYTAGGLSLNFRVSGPVDTSLVVNGPSGQWLCDDDSGGDLDPLVTVVDPVTGRYDVWVGTLTSGVAGSGQSVQLQITELDSVASPDQTPDLGGEPVFGSVTLRAGFTPDPHRVDIVSGGTIDAASVGDSCMGNIGQAPDYQVNYTAGSSRLTFRAVGKGDSTLVINTPNGQWACDDDSDGNMNPRLTFKSPQSGRYDIWVGDFNDAEDGSSAKVQLQVTEVD